MECKDFLEGYSAYRDGLVDEAERDGFRAHLDACESCARYDRVVRKGTEVLRDLPRVDPPSDFLARLQHRIYHIEDGIPLDSSLRGGGAALVAVAAVGLLALSWLPFAVRTPVELELPTVAVEAPERPASPAVADAEELVDPGPFVRPAADVEQIAERLPAWSDVRLAPSRPPTGSVSTLGAGPAFSGSSPTALGTGR